MNANLSSREFQLFQKYIEEQCGICLQDDKAYLVESRLSRFLSQFNLTSFEELYRLLSQQNNPELAEQIIDAITTNETLWFREKTPWQFMEDVLLPQYIQALRRKNALKIRVWSAACATGQEPYSIAMCIHRYLETHGITDITLNDFEIIATDLSKNVLKLASLGKYDNISLARGMDQDYRNRYFRQEGRTWLLNEMIKQSVHFQHFNLQNSFLGLGQFHLIFLRYVAIYFSENLKKLVIRKMAKSLTESGVLILGNSEVLFDYKDCYEAELYQNVHFYRLRGEKRENIVHR